MPIGSRSLATALLVASFLAGCQSAKKAASDAPPSFAQRVAQAHGVESWDSQKALSGRIDLAFGNSPPFSAKFVYEIHGGRTRMETADGTLMVWDGTHAWVSPAASPIQRARFTLLTFPYFIALPFKLDDPGVYLEAPQQRELSKRPYVSARMTFAPGTGDSPDDWYVLYADPNTHRLETVAYIVTYGKPAAKAEEDPHAVSYYDVEDIDGVKIPTEWRFWNYNKDVGLHGQPIGHARLSDLQFVAPKPNTFAKPQDAREDLPPVK